MLASEPFDRLVPAVDRAARVLALLEAEGRGLGISELARRLRASKGSVRDVLETLRSHGLLDRDEATKQYALGAGLVRLGQAAAQGLDLTAVARPHLARLAEATAAAALLFVRQDERAVIVERAEAGQAAMRISATVGRRVPLLAGACGKVFLAYADPAERQELLGRLPRFTERTVVELERYTAELDGVRARGYALDDQEYLDGVRAAGAPVFDARGDLAAVVLAAGLAGTVAAERLIEIGQAAARAGRDISAGLGTRIDTTGVSGP